MLSERRTVVGLFRPIRVGKGITLHECWDCGAMVKSPGIHIRWHHDGKRDFALSMLDYQDFVEHRLDLNDLPPEPTRPDPGISEKYTRPKK